MFHRLTRNKRVRLFFSYQRGAAIQKEAGEEAAYLNGCNKTCKTCLLQKFLTFGRAIYRKNAANHKKLQLCCATNDDKFSVTTFFNFCSIYDAI